MQSSAHIIEQPLSYSPRTYQLPLLNYLASGGRRALAVWHRRAGKGLTVFNLTVKRAWFDRVGTYYYFYPTYAQGKKALWDGMDNNGKSYLSYIPSEMIAPNGLNETEMQIKLKNGSIIQIVGTDRYDSVRSTNPVMVVLDEYQDQDPMAFKTVEPILQANKGIAVFTFTPRGRNHAWKMYDFARGEKGWFTQTLNIDETADEEGNPIITHEQIDEMRRRGEDEDFIQQEYYCSFNGVVSGSYYGKSLTLAREQGRITNIPHNPRYPVLTAWDLGRDDLNSIWFIQMLPGKIHVIDYYEGRQEGLEHYVSIVRQRYSNYSFHVLPKDINVTEYASNQKRIDAAYSMGLKALRVAPNLSVQEGIDAVRRVLPICYFDAEKCKRGIEALEDYHKKKDEKFDTYSVTPHHTWSSNASDAFRYFAVTVNSEEDEAYPIMKQQYADSGFNVFDEPLYGHRPHVMGV